MATFTSAFNKALNEDIQTTIDSAIAIAPGGIERVKKAKQMGEKAMSTVAVEQNKMEILKEVDAESKKLCNEKEDLGKRNVDTSEIQKKIEACKLVKAEITKSVNTQYGTHRERDSITQYEQQHSVAVIRENKWCWKSREIAPDIFLIGHVDGLIDKDCVLEVKNRTRKRNLMDSISPLENVQVQAYLFLFERPRAILLQCFRESEDTTLKPIEVVRDEKFWNETVVRRMQACAKVLSDICNNQEEAVKYSSMSADEREAFLIQMIVK